MTDESIDARPAVSLRGVVVGGLDGAISFDLATGECVAILDPNPARTALLRVIAGVEAPVTGTLRSGTASAVWHDDGMAENVPVERTITERLRASGSGLEAEQLLAGIGLSHRAGHEPWAMSVGERRRIAIEVAFCSATSVVVLDEPERGLDARSLDWLADRIGNGRQVVLIATHNVQLAHRCGDFVVANLADLYG